MRSWCCAVAVSLLAAVVRAQAPGVPIYEVPSPGEESAEERALIQALERLRAQGGLLDFAASAAQLDRRTCELTLPQPVAKPLAGPELWRLARASYVRVGFYYQCKNCDQWHLNLAGGYAIAAGGIVATCHHVIVPDEHEMKAGFLICADEAGRVHIVHEVLACDPDTDVAILRTGAELPPLPLRTAVVPGEKVFLFSDPMGTRGFFSDGIVNRFASEPVEGKATRRVVVDVSTDWAPGSSGAAVIDECGNVIGHVSTISTHDDFDDEPDAGAAPSPVEPDVPPGRSTLMAMHHATRAHDVLALVRTPPPAVPVPRRDSTGSGGR
jgi:S1-C subfamily serine protease